MTQNSLQFNSHDSWLKSFAGEIRATTAKYQTDVEHKKFSDTFCPSNNFSTKKAFQEDDNIFFKLYEGI